MTTIMITINNSLYGDTHRNTRCCRGLLQGMLLNIVIFQTSLNMLRVNLFGSKKVVANFLRFIRIEGLATININGNEIFRRKRVDNN